MAGETLPAPLALVIQWWRGRVGIRVGSLMLSQVAHRDKVLPTQSTTVLLSEGVDGQNPSRITRTCDPGVEGVAHRSKVFSPHYTTVLPSEGHGHAKPFLHTRTCDPGVEGVH